MSRGKWKSTLVKQAVGQAVLEAEAIMLATEKMKQKVHAKKSLSDSFREHIGKMIDRVDPLEIIAIGASTYLVHGVLLAAQDLINYLVNLPAHALDALAQFNTSWLDFIFGPNPNKEGNPTPTEDITVLGVPSLALWGIAFLISFVIVRYGAQIVQSLGGIVGIGKLFAGMI